MLKESFPEEYRHVLVGLVFPFVVAFALLLVSLPCDECTTTEDFSLIR